MVFADADGRIAVGRDAVHLARAVPERFESAPKRCIDGGHLCCSATGSTPWPT
ncbi:hypothetical protein [Dactylosporangium sp. NPDC051541]|uniref:hypothetical protein n=1 Tax=Dactylosporangium sp. NPDC051541 TaxID=3363977 RepID=UPI0037B4E9D4